MTNRSAFEVLTYDIHIVEHHHYLKESIGSASNALCLAKACDTDAYSNAGVSGLGMERYTWRVLIKRIKRPESC